MKMADSLRRHLNQLNELSTADLVQRGADATSVTNDIAVYCLQSVSETELGKGRDWAPGLGIGPSRNVWPQPPNYLSNSFARQNSNHSYSTRNNDFLILPKVRTNYGKRTFLFSGAGLFNSLPPKIRNVDNKDFARLSREFFKIRMNFY